MKSPTQFLLLSMTAMLAITSQAMAYEPNDPYYEAPTGRLARKIKKYDKTHRQIHEGADKEEKLQKTFEQIEKMRAEGDKRSIDRIEYRHNNHLGNYLPADYYDRPSDDNRRGRYENLREDREEYRETTTTEEHVVVELRNGEYFIPAGQDCIVQQGIRLCAGETVVVPNPLPNPQPETPVYPNPRPAPEPEKPIYPNPRPAPEPEKPAPTNPTPATRPTIPEEKTPPVKKPHGRWIPVEKIPSKGKKGKFPKKTPPKKEEVRQLEPIKEVRLPQPTLKPIQMDLTLRGLPVAKKDSIPTATASGDGVTAIYQNAVSVNNFTGRKLKHGEHDETVIETWVPSKNGGGYVKIESKSQSSLKVTSGRGAGAMNIQSITNKMVTDSLGKASVQLQTGASAKASSGNTSGQL